MAGMRLDKYVSNQFPLTRSEAKSAIRRGRVAVDGVAVCIPDYKVVPDTQTVSLDGTNAEYKKYIYLILNKPAGVLSASRDANAKTVLDLVPDQFRRRELFCVGRLDKDTTGMLLITDDGEFSHSLMSPKRKVPKTYEVFLDDEPSHDLIEQFKKGIVLFDGTVCMPARLELPGDNRAVLQIYEGKYHQVKRMFGAVGLGVNRLHRISIGALSLPSELNFGQMRELNEHERSLLFEG